MTADLIWRCSSVKSTNKFWVEITLYAFIHVCTYVCTHMCICTHTDRILRGMVDFLCACIIYKESKYRIHWFCFLFEFLKQCHMLIYLHCLREKKSINIHWVMLHHMHHCSNETKKLLCQVSMIYLLSCGSVCPLLHQQQIWLPISCHSFMSFISHYPSLSGITNNIISGRIFCNCLATMRII